MKILGLAKLTLLDFPGKTACTVFTGYCNLRCPFCHNPSLVFGEGEEISQDTIISLLKKRKGILDGVCITGGEPLLNDDIFDLMYKIKELDYSIKLDTNGCFPEKLQQAFDENFIDYIAMDIKNSIEKYPLSTGLKFVDIDKIKRSCDIIMSSGKDYEFRTTVMHPLHNTEDFISIRKWLNGAKKYFLQSFKDTGDLLTNAEFQAFSQDELEKIKELLSPYFQYIGIRT